MTPIAKVVEGETDALDGKWEKVYIGDLLISQWYKSCGVIDDDLFVSAEDQANKINAALGSFIQKEDARQALEAIQYYLDTQKDNEDRVENGEGRDAALSEEEALLDLEEAATRLRKALGV